MNEIFIAAMLCNLLGGADAETAKKFDNLGEERRIRVDCETPSHVIEIGWDHAASSRDSVHQAVFASVLTNKTPMVLLIDTDGEEGRYEQEMRMVTKRLGIAYHFCRKDFLIRWFSTQSFRDFSLLQSNDLPAPDIAVSQCNLDLPASTEKLDSLPTPAVTKD